MIKSIFKIFATLLTLLVPVKTHPCYAWTRMDTSEFITTRVYIIITHKYSINAKLLLIVILNIIFIHKLSTGLLFISII